MVTALLSAPIMSFTHILTQEFLHGVSTRGGHHFRLSLHMARCSPYIFCTEICFPKCSPYIFYQKFSKYLKNGKLTYKSFNDYITAIFEVFDAFIIIIYVTLQYYKLEIWVRIIYSVRIAARKTEITLRAKTEFSGFKKRAIVINLPKYCIRRKRTHLLCLNEIHKLAFIN
jgi:hypothetical protein